MLKDTSLIKKNITIITAIYNSAPNIIDLCSNINAISSDNFDWVIVDGNSTDESLDLIEQHTARVTTIISEDDFGIYDALNKGIKACVTPYYLVIGADDLLNEDVISNFDNIIENTEHTYDIVTSKILVEGVVKSTKGGGTWLNKQSAFVSSHAVGTIFKKDLHEKFGYYSNKFPIAADQLFILKVCKYKANIYQANHISGTFSKEGVSSQDVLGTLSESYRIQMMFENKYVQTIIFILKLVKNFKKL